MHLRHGDPAHGAAWQDAAHQGQNGVRSHPYKTFLQTVDRTAGSSAQVPSNGNTGLGTIWGAPQPPRDEECLFNAMRASTNADEAWLNMPSGFNASVYCWHLPSFANLKTKPATR